MTSRFPSNFSVWSHRIIISQVTDGWEIKQEFCQLWQPEAEAWFQTWQPAFKLTFSCELFVAQCDRLALSGWRVQISTEPSHAENTSTHCSEGIKASAKWHVFECVQWESCSLHRLQVSPCVWTAAGRGLSLLLVWTIASSATQGGKCWQRFNCDRAILTEVQTKCTQTLQEQIVDLLPESSLWSCWDQCRVPGTLKSSSMLLTCRVNLSSPH